MEYRFSLNRRFPRNCLALEAASFTQNKRILLLQLIGKLHTDTNDSHNKVICNQSFESLYSLSKMHDKSKINQLKENGKN